MSLAELQHKVKSVCPSAYAYKDRLWIVWYCGRAIGVSAKSEYDAWARALEHAKHRRSISIPVC